MDGSGYATTYNGTSSSGASDMDERARAWNRCPTSQLNVVQSGGYRRQRRLLYRELGVGVVDRLYQHDRQHLLPDHHLLLAAVDGSGYGLTFNGTSWTAASDIDGSHALESISCVQLQLLQSGR